MLPNEEHLTLQENACTEQFQLIVEDLAQCLIADPRPLLYDGYAAPHILKAIISNNSHAYYLITADSFQSKHYQERPWIKEVLSGTSDPGIAWEPTFLVIIWINTQCTSE